MTLKHFLFLIFPLVLGACENSTQVPTGFQPAKPFVPPPLPATQKIVTVDQSQLMHASKPANIAVGTTAVDQANKRAVIQANSTRTQNAIIVFPYDTGNLFQIYATPLNVTDVQFQPGEQIISVAAGDTVRWQISKTVSGADSNRTEHLLIKPYEENLDTTMVVTTSLRTYHILLKSTKNTFMANVQWQYPEQQSLNGASPEAASSTNLSAPAINFSNIDLKYDSYVRRGNTPDWMPKAVFNDGLKTYIEFPDHIQSAPALFIKESGSGDAAVNYRVVGNYYVVDQVITAAELTSGDGRTVVAMNYQK